MQKECKYHNTIVVFHPHPRRIDPAFDILITAFDRSIPTFDKFLNDDRSYPSSILLMKLTFL